MVYPAKIRGKVSKEKLEELYHEKKMTMKQIAKLYRCNYTSVREYMILLGITIRKTTDVRALASPKSVNEHFFSEWSNEVAYILGIIITDGSFEKNGDLRISMTDFDVIHGIAKAIELKNGLSYVKKKKNHKQQLKISICRSQIINDLKQLGVNVDGTKTFKQKFIDIPAQYRSHFIRGIFDGDGSIVVRRRRLKTGIFTSKELTIITTSSYSLAKGVCNTMYEDLNIKLDVYHQIKATTKQADVYRVNLYSKENVHKFFNYIYKDKDYLFMHRKYAKFFE
ncbi:MULTISPECIES: LAGLIDADG family homing endonuclease [Bacillus]|uniref:LAGLIDADG family homing endonuclease n=1 Tax=Bacillus TaxID=1386 RepID=UPI00211107B3|nr:LAGLIDADG family homing endonuclease [Bacillus paranthracis]MCQ6520058.1 LAGLIDADG family homing endonuclease [Bacillus paranthracis]MCU5227263.1 LAGLIDADG family homing endonuclease [Bacillus paranthracis]MEC4603860.1 LAGLIDADG family homing endonuclease [Bacillus paranthracis]